MRTSIAAMLSALVLIWGCSGARVAVAPGYENLEAVLYTGISFGPGGIPVFTDRTDKRPTDPGDDFYIVMQDREGLPHIYYHVAVTGGESPEFSKPFKTFGKRAVTGLVGGVMFAGAVINSSSPSDRDEADVALALAATGVVVGTVGGIAVGFVEGAYEAVLETGKALVISSEEILSFSTFKYGIYGKLTLIRAFEPNPFEDDPPIEMFRIRYVYEGDSDTPARLEFMDMEG